MRSGRGARDLPSIERRSSELFVEGSSIEMALMGEGVVSGRVDGEKTLR